MRQLWKWYNETCQLSHVLLVGAAVWCVSAWILLREAAPLIYVGLHLLTTGVFTLLVLRAQRQSESDVSDPK
ncbi:MAG TPA: hypothetical protein VMM56_05750 [Planctomycetaceae bacterium]|nr:hypothetical protein [Planctomycetaceae bacterium]